MLKEDNELLTRVGPGTPMGDLMRRYWHPVAASKDLADRPFRTKEIRILGEDLVLFRDRGGRLGLLERYCAHRGVNLAIGVVEQDGIRCQYHGWKYGRDGACLEQPFEDTRNPQGNFRGKCRLKAYVVTELAGLIWAYLGPQPAPLLPHWEPLMWENVVRDIAITALPCNWLQCQENSLDPVHTEWLHNYFADYVSSVKRHEVARVGGTSAKPHRAIAFDPFEHGIIKRRMVEGDTGAEDDWRIGHPVLFPNILSVGDLFTHLMQFRVPVDDTHTCHISQYMFHAAPGHKAPAQEHVPYRTVPLHEGDGDWLLDFTFNQDYMAWVSQGPVARREREKLGASDQGIIMFRALLKRQLERIQAGLDPMNTFREAEKNTSIPLPTERVKHGIVHRPRYIPEESGVSADVKLIEAALATWDTTEYAAAAR